MSGGLDTPLLDRYEVLVIGGGIHGAMATYEATRRGLSVLLVERDDFGAGTSFNSLKIVHGGLRYLRDLDLRGVVDSHRELRILSKIAPHIVRPLACRLDPAALGPLFTLKFRAGLALYAILARRAARSVPEPPAVPASRFPGWYDGIITDTEALLFDVLHTAVSRGHGRTAVRNRVEAELVREDGRVVAARIPGAAETRVAAVIECVGTAQPNLPVGLAMNLVVDPLELTGSGVARALVHPEDRRHVFVVPWRGTTIAGTFERPYPGDPMKALRIEPEWIRECLVWLAPAHPELAQLTPANVRFVHAGLLPRESPEIGHLLHAARIEELDDGRIRVLGPKYTTARAVASRAVVRACRRLGRRAGPDYSSLPELVDRRRLVAEFVAAEPGREHSLGPPPAPRRGDVIFALERELARDLGDVLLRRTGTASAGHPGVDVVAAVAGVMRGLCGWSELEMRRQVESFEADFHFARALQPEGST